MEAKEAIALAKRYVSEYFGDEGIENVGLEELTQDNGVWGTTIGFSRPWDSIPVQVHNSSRELIGTKKPVTCARR